MIFNDDPYVEKAIARLEDTIEEFAYYMGDTDKAIDHAIPAPFHGYLLVEDDDEL